MNEYGKIPPQAVDIEKAILGALLLDSNAMYRTEGIIDSGAFYTEAHQNIFQAIEALTRQSKAADLFTVSEKLREEGKLEAVGGAFYLAELTNVVSTSANIEYHASIVAEKYTKRQVIRLSSEALKNAYDDTVNVYETIDAISDGMIEISNQLIKDDTQTWKGATEQYVMEVIDRMKSGITETGTRIGLKEIDETIAGFRAGLYVIGGRPSMGKSALGFDFACRFAEQKKGKVGIFTLEMSRTQLINRVVARYSQINQTRLINSNIKEYELNQLIAGGGTASELDFLISDKPNISINQIRSKAKVWAHKNKLSAIFVDYIQLVKGTNKQRHLEIGEISRGLKQLSNELDIPVFALCQLGREKDAGKSMPRMSELRESGDIEQDADSVMLLYRPEYYGITHDSEGISTKDLTKVIIEKNRNGAINIKGANVRGNLAINRYEDWDFYPGTEPTATAQPQPEEKIKVTGKDEDFLPF